MPSNDKQEELHLNSKYEEADSRAIDPAFNAAEEANYAAMRALRKPEEKPKP